MMSKRSLSSEPMPLQGHCASCLCFDDLHLISLIIILRVSFCSDIWYCNILTYYLGNILAYYQDNYSRRADSIMASFQLICHVHFLPESDTFRIHRPSVENSLVLIVASVKYNRRSEKNIENCFFHINLRPRA